mgnify:FL=1
MYQMLNEVDDDVLHCTSRRLHDADGALSASLCRGIFMTQTVRYPQSQSL